MRNVVYSICVLIGIATVVGIVVHTRKMQQPSLAPVVAPAPTVPTKAVAIAVAVEQANQLPRRPETKATPEIATDEVALATSAVTTAPPITQSIIELPKKLSLDVSLETSSDLLKNNDPEHVAGIDIAIMPAVRISDRLKLRGILAFSQALTAEQNISLSRSDIALSYAGATLNPFLKLSSSAAVTLPLGTQKFSRESLLTAIRLAPRLSFNLDRTILRQLSGFYEVSFARAFHSFTTSTTGVSNRKYQINQRVNLDLGLSDKLTISSIFGFLSGWSYESNQINRFEWTEEASFQINQSLAIGVGISNSGNTLRPNGFDSNIALLDPHTSNIYGSLTYVY